MLLAAGLLLVVLLIASPAYGYHRDELYFRMLPPAWGYIDQPPLAPLIARAVSAVVDQVWALRVPAAIVAAASVVVVGAITAEVGGTRRAQLLAVWGYAFANFTLQVGHVLLTATFDLLVWPLVLLCALRAVGRDRPAWWLVAGLVTGLSLYNKLLVAVLLVAIAVGLLVAGPRTVRTWTWAAAGCLVAVVVGLPNLIYQVQNGFPQLQMGAALSAHNGFAVRPFVVLFLIVLLGPSLVPVWIAGLVALLRRPAWRPVRFLGVALIACVALVIVLGAQFYYCYGVLTAVYAVGCVPLAEWTLATGRLRLVQAAIAVNALASAVVGLPIVPLPLLGLTPVPAIDQTLRDQVGWPAYAKEIAAVPAVSRPGTILLTTNYGEAGAIARFDPSLRSRVYSGHNELQRLPAPPASTTTVVTVGYGLEWVEKSFRTCFVATRLDSGLDVHSEEQNAPVRVCTGRTAPMSRIWSQAAHLG